MNDRERLVAVWAAFGCAHNPEDFKEAVRERMWAQVIEMAKESATRATRIDRENRQLIEEICRLRGNTSSPVNGEYLMQEIAVAELRVSDIGARVIVIDKAGNAYDGTLVNISATTWEWGERAEEKIRTRIAVESGGGSALKLGELPLDFRLQAERTPLPMSGDES